MESANPDMCLLSTPGLKENTHDHVVLPIQQTKNTFTTCIQLFFALENKAYSRFESKPLKIENIG